MDVKVSIKTIQYDENGKSDTINVNATGSLYDKNNETYVVYKEKEGENEITTTLKFSENEVTIKRFGSMNTTMVLEKQKTNTTRYRTPQGMFIIETYTKDLNIIKEDDIKINIDYDIRIMDLFAGRNKINIHIQKKN